MCARRIVATDIVSSCIPTLVDNVLTMYWTTDMYLFIIMFSESVIKYYYYYYYYPFGNCVCQPGSGLIDAFLTGLVDACVYLPRDATTLGESSCRELPRNRKT